MQWEQNEMNEYVESIIKIIEDVNPYEEITEETDLVETELLDSLTLVFIVTQLEEMYGITIDEKLITPNNFSKIRKIAELVENLLSKKED